MCPKKEKKITLIHSLYITPPSPHRIFDLKDSLDKQMHFFPQLSNFVPLRNGFPIVKGLTFFTKYKVLVLEIRCEIVRKGF